MLTLAVVACLAVATSAQMMGPMNNNYMGGAPQMMGGNYLQQLMMQGMMGNQGQQYPQQYPQPPQQPRPQQQPMNNNVIGSLLGNMLGMMLMQGLQGQRPMGNNGGYMDGQDNEREYELERMQELLKNSMATEMFDLMRAYNKHKEDEAEFKDAMYHLCFMVNATWYAARMYNKEIYNKTTDETGERMEQEMMGMTDEEKMTYMINLMTTDQQTWEEMFFRMTAWSCWAGQNYMNSGLQLEKMEKGDKCDH